MATNSTNAKNTSNTERYEKSSLKELDQSAVQSSDGSSDSGSSLFADKISGYNEEKGYYKIKNPGWIKIDFGAAKKISYIRFLLWDNRGSEAKRQASNRKYTYRLLIEEADSTNSLKDDNSKCTIIEKVCSWLKKCAKKVVSFFIRSGVKGDRSLHNGNGSKVGGTVWTAIYENTLNPSNGWQEFYFESRPRMIKAIKIQFFQNTSASTTHNNYTQLVSVQAYENPTKAIAQLLNLDTQTYAPLPNLGFIRNRVIVGGSQDIVNNLVENEIINKVKEYIKAAESVYPDLGSLRIDLDGNSKNAERADIEKQIQIFNMSILKPIEAFDKALSERFRFYTIVAVVLSVFGIVKEILDIVTLTNGKANPLTISCWLDFIFRNNT